MLRRACSRRIFLPERKRSMREKDREYMRMALALAAKGRGRTHPNPMVGAVVVNGGEVVGKGYHRGPGHPHAEVEALRRAGERARGGELYVNLEPCNHRGRTPPCTESILAYGVKRVVYSLRDPNPAVRGGGAEKLRTHGVEVVEGVLAEEASELNAPYLKHVTTGLPLVRVKSAMTSDGKAAARTGRSQWITGEAARREAHRMRRESDAVVVGRGTVEADDPRLTVRLVPLGAAKPPIRVVVDSRLSIDPESSLAQGGEPQVVVATTADHDRRKADLLRSRGVEVWVLPPNEEGVCLETLLRELGARGAAYVLVEGGPRLIGSFFRCGLVDEVALFVAPLVMGDVQARSWVEGRTVEDIAGCLTLRWKKSRRVGGDILLEGEVGQRREERGGGTTSGSSLSGKGSM